MGDDSVTASMRLGHDVVVVGQLKKRGDRCGYMLLRCRPSTDCREARENRLIRFQKECLVASSRPIREFISPRQ